MNSNYVSRYARLGLLVGSIITTSISLTFIEPVHAQSRTFFQPRLSPSGQASARIDRCTDSFRFPDHCSRASAQEAANRFCNWMGFQRAVQFSTVDRSWKQREWVWKYTEKWNNGNLERFWTLGEGGFMIEGVECGR